MQDNVFVFRPAIREDSERIWDILHAQVINWSEAKIQENIELLYLLLQGEKLLGVLYHATTQDVTWMAIHPCYPEGPFVSLMLENWRGLHAIREIKVKKSSGTFCRYQKQLPDSGEI